MQTARDARGDRESGAIGSPAAAAKTLIAIFPSREPRAGQCGRSGPPGLMWDTLFAAMQATRAGEHCVLISVRTALCVLLSLCGRALGLAFLEHTAHGTDSNAGDAA